MSKFILPMWLSLTFAIIFTLFFMQDNYWGLIAYIPWLMFAVLALIDIIKKWRMKDE